MTEDKKTSDRRGILRAVGTASLAAIGFTGAASASGKDDYDKKTPPGHKSKKSGERGNKYPGKKGKGKKKGHYPKKSGKRGNKYPGKKKKKGRKKTPPGHKSKKSGERGNKHPGKKGKGKKKGHYPKKSGKRGKKKKYY
ncbi:hypothetical protein [Haloterrigena salifodinae]|uniref:Uncharacterized protein n=1 Tax=Haloterrigena salifodinae TaxID=2675099 RepID=A0A8T8E6Z9_9EURY|nr:hypothetical protein [Haloterrigena salifodinae]QRV17489.1 hypothetical protein JMJ58_21885 [Haloterrigena salifodinae]